MCMFVSDEYISRILSENIIKKMVMLDCRYFILAGEAGKFNDNLFGEVIENRGGVYMDVITDLDANESTEDLV